MDQKNSEKESQKQANRQKAEKVTQHLVVEVGKQAILPNVLKKKDFLQREYYYNTTYDSKFSK